MLNKINNTTIIMVLHDRNQFHSYSDEIIAMSTKGKIFVQGNPEEVITSYLIKDIYDIELDLIEVNRL